MKKLIPLIFLLSIFVLSSCDSGDIYPTDNTEITGISVNTTFRFLHVETFPVNYEIYLGAFSDESTLPLSSKAISKPAENEAVNISLSNVPADAVYLRLCLAQAGKKTLYVFYEAPLDLNSKKEINIAEQEINLLQYRRIQQQVFRQCVTCHSNSDKAAGGLHLTDGISYANLINIQSQCFLGRKRVEPFSVANSFLIDVLKDNNDSVSYPHYTGLSSFKSDDLTLLQEWIKAGATED